MLTFRTRESGFTLLEVLIALAIMGLVLVVSVPLVSGPRAGFEVKAAGTAFARAAREARVLAIRLNRPVAVRLDVVARQLSIDQGEPITLGSADLEITFTTARSLTLNEETGSVIFFADGSSSGGMITLARNGISRTYVISWITGQVGQEGAQNVDEG